MSRQTAKRVLRAVQAGQVGPLDNPGFADGDDHRLPRLRSTHLQAEEAERTGAVDLPVEVATPLLALHPSPSRRRGPTEKQRTGHYDEDQTLHGDWQHDTTGVPRGRPVDGRRRLSRTG